MGFFKKLFNKNKKIDLREKAREVSSSCRKEQRGLQRQVNEINNSKKKVEIEIKKLAKRGDREGCRVLAKEIVNSNKIISRFHNSIAQLKSLDYQVCKVN